MKPAWIALALLTAMACSRAERTSQSDGASAPAELERQHECAACGMIIVEQPSPRAQLVHSDGTREFLCSIGDLLAYLEAPSPHGEVVSVWVETLDPTADPRAYTVDARPWRAAASTHYVVGIDKQRVMGAAIMAYETLSAARAIAQRYGGRVVDLAGLQKLRHLE